MNLDPKALEKILSMDNEALSELAKAIARAAGANPAKAQLIAQNPELLKKKISSVSPQEAQQLIDAAGREKSEEIAKMLKERGINLGG